MGRVSFRVCLDVFVFISIHMCRSGFGVELKLFFTSIHSNKHALRWIRVHSNKALIVYYNGGDQGPVRIVSGAILVCIEQEATVGRFFGSYFLHSKFKDILSIFRCITFAIYLDIVCKCFV